MKKNSFVGWLASHVMLALVVLAQVVFPAYSLKASCTPGEGPYEYNYDPVPSGFGDWTESNIGINQNSMSGPYSDGSYFGAFTGQADPWGDKVQIALSFSNSQIRTGKLEVFSTPGWGWDLVYSTNFVAYQWGGGVEMLKSGDCKNGYKVKITINGCSITPYIERMSNNY